MKKILFTGGGSAGHVVPNLALMRELKFTHELLYMGSGGIEERLATEAGYPFLRVECPKLVRAFTLENFKIPFRLRRACRKALALLKEKKPDLVFSKGGYVSYPAVWAAAKLKIPVLTHESDLSAGLCTKLIAKKCEAVLTSFPETAKRFPKGVYVGSPVRREVLSGDRARARKKFGLPEKCPVLLVFGGGSGSRALNEAVVGDLPRLLEHFSILHITGGQGIPERREKAGKNLYIARDFEADMGSAYAAADIVLCRAGSNTLFELLALKKRAVLVPLSHASRGDQAENARYFAQKGLFRVLPEEALGTLTDVLIETEKDPALGERLQSCGVESGTDAIVQFIKKTLANQVAGGARV